MLDLEYKFWETQEDKFLRLKKIWINLKRKNALTDNSYSDEFKNTREHHDLVKNIVEITRKMRWRVDQEMVSRHLEPIFKENYYSYTKDEFMIDAEFEFYKIKNLLSKNPRLLREDPVLSVDYLRIINLIKQKKMLERSSDKFDPTASPAIHFYDTDLEEWKYQNKIEEQQREVNLLKFDDDSVARKKSDQYRHDQHDKSLETDIKQTRKTRAKD